MTFDKDVILARIRRSGFEVAAGQYYADATRASELCSGFDLDADRFLMGAYKSYECWTCLFMRNTFFRNGSVVVGMDNKVLLDLLHDYFFRAGKGSEVEFIEIGRNESIWLPNGAAAAAFQNVLLLLSQRNEEASSS